MYIIETKHGSNIYKEANRYIKTKIAQAKHELDINFIKKCLNNESLPAFTKLKLATKNNKRFINNIRAQITEQELNNKTRNKRRLDDQIQKIINNLFDLPPEEWDQLFKLTNAKVEKIVAIKTNIHNKKLESLGIKIDLTVNNRFINNNRNRINQVESINNKQNIFNYSNRQLTQTETKVLEKGLKYGIKTKKLTALKYSLASNNWHNH